MTAATSTRRSASSDRRRVRRRAHGDSCRRRAIRSTAPSLRQDHREQYLGGRGGVADVPAIEAHLVDEQHDRARCIVRAAERHQLRLPEQLKLQYDLDDDDDDHRAPDRGQRDAPQASASGRRCPAPRPRRVLAGTCCSAARNSIIGRPRHHQIVVMAMAGKASVSLVEECHRRPAEDAEQHRNEAAVGKEHHAPQQRDDGYRQHRGREEHRAQNRSRPRRPVERQCQCQSDHRERRHRQQEEVEGIADRAEEQVVAEQPRRSSRCRRRPCRRKSPPCTGSARQPATSG